MGTMPAGSSPIGIKVIVDPILRVIEFVFKAVFGIEA